MRRHILIPVLAVLGVFLASARAAQAWGPEGHVIAGKIAEQYLLPKARAAIADLLEGRPISDSRLVNWADYIKSSKAYERKYPKHRTWHYIDIELQVKEADFDPLADEHNVVYRIGHFKGLLGDLEQVKDERKEALLFLLHFVGDMHQPLHCAEREKDQGGNLVPIRSFRGQRQDKLNLHRVWDSSLLLADMGAVKAEDYAVRLSREIAPEDRAKWQQGSVKAWAWEAHLLALEKVYKFADSGKPLPAGGAGDIELTDDNYVQANIPVVRAQLKRGGVRLAKVLNDVLGRE